MRKNLLTHLLLCFLLPALMPVAASAQNITTIAGCGVGDDSLATKAELFGPVAVTFDTSGNAYIADEASYHLRKVSPAGIISTIAGCGIYGYSGDGGQATDAKITDIYGLATDRHGNVFFADNGNNVVRKIDPSGIITTVCGTGVAGFAGDNGPAIAAKLNSPIDLVVDAAGNLLLTDWLNNRVRKINTAGIITTVVGNGGVSGLGAGGPATASSLGRPFRLALDNKGNMYVAAVIFQCITKVDTGGIITIVGGNGVYAIGPDGDGGPATAATMSPPCGLAVDTAGNIYFSDIDNFRVRKITKSTGIINNYAGTGVAGYNGDGGSAPTAQLSILEGLFCDKAGNLFICDADNNRVREVSPGGTISTFAGQNTLFGEGYNAVNAEMSIPANICTDRAGNIYVADLYNNRVRKIDAITNTITTVAGSGIGGSADGFSGDGGAALLANMYNPVAVAVDGSGNLFIADEGNERIRKVSASGIISTIAGTGTGGYNGEGPATHAELNSPTGIAVDNAGNLYVADQANNRVRKITPAGLISTVAGLGASGFSGDGGLAITAKLYAPADLSFDGMGNLYIADNGNSRIRKIDTNGIITTVVGTGTAGFLGDGSPAAAAQLNYPDAVKADSAGNLFICDGFNQRVRMVGTDGIINTLAGNGTAGFSGDGGPALAAMLNNPSGVALDPFGNLFIADGQNYRIRKIGLTLSVPASPVASGINVYPNPAHDKIIVETKQGFSGGTIVLYDVAGRAVYTAPAIQSRQMIPVQNLPAGQYILQLTGSNGAQENVKVIKE